MTVTVAPIKPALLSCQPDDYWQSPTPIVPNSEHDVAPYPIGALPPIIQDAVLSYQHYGQQPLSMIACSALANVSLACQTLANVARDHLLVSPVSLFFLVIAGSGERKSAADYTFSKATRQWQLDARKQLIPEVRVAQTLQQAWRAEQEGILRQIHRNSQDGNCTETLRQRLVNVAGNEPHSDWKSEVSYCD